LQCRARIRQTASQDERESVQRPLQYAADRPV
jgi:hypothetical protein